MTARLIGRFIGIPIFADPRMKPGEFAFVSAALPTECLDHCEVASECRLQGCKVTRECHCYAGGTNVAPECSRDGCHKALREKRK